MARTRTTIDLSPSRIDFRLVRGDTWKMQVLIKADDESEIPVGVDLTGSTWTCHIKKSNEDGLVNNDPNTPIFASFEVDDSQQDSGIIFFTLDEEKTREAEVGEFYWYDIQQSRFNDIATPVQGRITVLPDVTIEGT